MEILHALCHNNTLGILPWSLADAVTRVDAGDASRFSRAQIGMPVRFGRARRLGERLTVCIGAGETTEVGAIALPTLVTKNDMAACCACVGAGKLSPVKATAANTGSRIADAMKKTSCSMNGLEGQPQNWMYLEYEGRICEDSQRARRSQHRLNCPVGS